MSVEKILKGIAKGLDASNKDLSNSQKEVLNIIQHLKSELRKLGKYANEALQNNWYNLSSSMLKAHVKSSAMPLFIKPKGHSALSFKSTNSKLLNSLESSIRSSPNEMLTSIEESISKVASAVLPDDLFKNTRGYIEKLVNQINICYLNSCYDASSLLMRRLLEILLILAFRKNGIEDQILDSNNRYIKLNSIINLIQNKGHFSIEHRMLKTMNDSKVLGNISAYKIEYTCLKQDIDKILVDYRVLVEKLAYDSGIKK